MNVTINNDGKKVKIYNIDGKICIKVIGSGPDAGAFYCEIDEATSVEINAAETIDETAANAATETNTTFNAAEETAETATESNTAVDDNAAEETADESIAKKLTDSFDEIISNLIELPPEMFMAFVGFAKRNGNKFPESSRFSKIVNADDAYCSALIYLTRIWSSDVEKKAFEVFGNSDSDISKTINMLCVLKSASTAVRDSGGDMQTFYCLKEVVDAYMSTL